jgi:type I restriction enzyme S subunit
VTPLRYLAAINPPTPEFDRLPDDASVPFVPLEAVWPDGLDVSRRRPKAQVAMGYTRFLERDIVIPKITPTFQADRTTIATGLDGGVAAGTTELHVVRVGRGADRRYVRYLLSSRPFLHGGEAEMIGVAGQKRVPDEWLRNLRVPVLLVAAQRAIADFLDAETARIDALIAKKRRVMDVLAEREGVVLERELQRSSRGAVPFRRLLSEPPQYGAVEPGDEGEPDWPRYVRITDLRPNGTLRDDDIKRLHPSVARPFLLHEGDLLFARSGATSGKAFRYQTSMGEAAFAGYLIRIRVDRACALPEFIELWTQTTHYWRQISEATVQATIQNVNAERYSELLVPEVPLATQTQLVRVLGQMRRDHRVSVRLLDRQISLLHERRQALITAAVTGQLDIPGLAA